ncbi:translesion DNA synthesis-associated protein ImuA [Ottowia sp.]|uniref:translesion DNA synthesis-associated protein ImuA n=1 Tax=Ottowia sp. TaxID=1898956 RepID=UPI002CC16173|nr:translesion DNA synthesis-associated protein ImuA [Ottowia sp.]HOB67452.1 translesion DNA synthesis-associated protein ImuA [Ottowia sp.]HPZ56314.1 translesion DNA synthesis-associated protein ImuA [Ottowia sp.]HQD47557.1 translesion DNA synthesis-associated protein ImuA [Ottowia sp.]
MLALSSLPASIGAGVWHADELLCVTDRVAATGHAALDAELPGGGWPLGALIELLQSAPAAAVWPLLLPAVAARQRAAGGAVALVNPPHEPFLPAFTAGGLAATSLLWLRGETPAAQLWATEQALRCADVAVALAWLPRARATDLRRLHAAAALRADSLLFVLRPEAALATSSCARLRLRVAVQAQAHGRAAWRDASTRGAGEARAHPRALAHPVVNEDAAPSLCVDILKRRGPPLAAPIHLPAQASPLRALLAASAQQQAARSGAVASGQVLRFDDQKESHALDRLAVAA